MCFYVFRAKLTVSYFLQFKSLQTEDVMDSKFRCVFDDTSNLVPAASSSSANKQAAAYGGESDGDSGNDKDLTEAFSGVQRTMANDHHMEPSAPVYATGSSLASRGKSVKLRLSF